MRAKRIVGGLFALIASLAMLPGIAHAEGVTYLDENGAPQTCETYSTVTSDVKTLTAGWWVVSSDTTVNERMEAQGDVHLILSNAATLTVEGGIHVAEANSLTICAQSAAKETCGRLLVNCAAGCAGIGGDSREAGGNITINGGRVDVTGTGGGCCGIGGGYESSSSGTIAITGGFVDVARGGLWGANGGGLGAPGCSCDVVISGGVVTVSGSLMAHGNGIAGKLSTGSNGSAVLYVYHGAYMGNPVADTSEQANWNILVYTWDEVTAYGDVTLNEDLNLPTELDWPGTRTKLVVANGGTLTVPSDKTVNIGSGAELEVNGNLVLEAGSRLSLSGSLSGTGSISPRLSCSVSDLEVTKSIYDGKAVQAGDVSYTYNGNGEKTMTWYSDNDGQIGSELSGAPVNPGSYWVKVAAVQTNFCTAATATARFSIEHDHAWSTNGWKSDAANHWRECTNEPCPITENSKKDGYAAHVWQDGKCATCGYECSHDTAADDGDCTTAVICPTCGKTVVSANEAHAWSGWTSDETALTHTHKCTTDGCDAAETKDCVDADGDHLCDDCGRAVSEHKGGTATCTAKAICAICKGEYGELNPDNHSGGKTWVQTATTHEQKWDCCDVVVSAGEGHEWKDGVCTECGYECKHSGGSATCSKKAVCEICGEAYGELDEDNHSGLTHVEAKAATTTSEGNIEYWYCTDCDEYFADKAAEKEIKKAETVIAKLAPSNNGKSDPNKGGDGASGSKGDGAGSVSKVEVTTTVSTDSVARGAANLPTTGDDAAHPLMLALLVFSGASLAAGTSLKKRLDR